MLPQRASSERISSPRPQRPAHVGALGTISVPGTKVGAFISISLVIVAWFVIPIARPFLIGTAAFGGIAGLILWRKHNR